MCFTWTISILALGRNPTTFAKGSSITPAFIVRLTQFLHTRGPVAKALSYQVLKSGTSAGANFEEADDGSSARDKVAKWRIVLRELKETRFRLRILRRCEFLTESQDPVINETIELIKIVSTIIGRNNGPDSAKE